MIPILVLVIAHLGEKLKEISKKAHMSVAALSAYLNEVHLILFVKVSPVVVVLHECVTSFLAHEVCLGSYYQLVPPFDYCWLSIRIL